MNHIYKVVWSKVRGCYVVVAEIARSNGKTHSQKVVAVLGTALISSMLFTGGELLTAEAAPQTFGTGTTASGTDSIAAGNSTKASGANSIAAGNTTTASGSESIALGTHNTASGMSSIAFGGTYLQQTVRKHGKNYLVYQIGDNTYYKDGNNYYSTADDTQFTGDTSSAVAVMINGGNTASGTGSVAFGEGTKAIAKGAVAFGLNTQAGSTTGGQNSIAFGNYTQALGGRSVAFGEYTIANYNDSVAFGNDTRALSTGATAFGNRTRALAQYSTAWGNATVAADEESTAWGTDTIAGAKLDENGAVTNNYKINPKDKNEPVKQEQMDVHGNLAYIQPNGKTAGIKQMKIDTGTELHDYVVLAGQDVNTYVRDYQGSLWKVNVDANGKVTVDTSEGSKDKVYNGQTRTSLAKTTVNGSEVDITPDNVLIKAHEGSNGYNIDGYANATAFGYSTEASGDNATAFGNDTKAAAAGATAFGYKTLASGENSTAFGESSIAAAKNSLAALGGTTTDAATNAAAIGNGAKATLADSVALGSGAVASRAKYSDLKSNAEKAAYAKDSSTGAAWEATANAIAIGNDSTVTRQLTGVAAGSLDTDAVNVAQLRAVDARHTTVSVGNQKVTADNTLVKGGNLELTRTTSNGQANFDVSLNKDVTLGVQEENKGGSLVVNSVAQFRKSPESSETVPVKEAVKIDGTTVSVVKNDGTNDQRQVVLGVGQDTGGYVALFDNTGKKPTYIFNAISAGVTYLKDKNTYPENEANEFNRLEYGDIYNGSTQFIATLDDGLKFAGDQGTMSAVKLNQKLSITGGVTDPTSLSKANNIGVVSSQDGEDGKLELRLNKDLSDLNSVTAGNVRIGNNPANTLKLTENGQETENTAPAGNYATGLDNKAWDTKNPSYVSGRAATEDQLAKVSGVVDKGLSFTTNTKDAANTTDNYKGYKVVNRQLGDTISIKAGDADPNMKYETKNLTSQIAENGDITISMADKPTFSEVTASSFNLSPKDTTTKDQAGNTASAQLNAHYRDASLNPKKNVTMADGSTGMVRLHYHDGERTVHDLATMDDGQIYAGDIKTDGTEDTTGFGRKMNEKTTINGGVKEKDNLTDNNIGVVSNGTDTLTVKLAKKLKNLESVQAGKTTMDGNGLTIKKSDDDSGKNVVVLGDQVAFGDNQVNHMGSGSDGTGTDGKPSYNNLTNGANIGDVKNIANSTVQPVIDTVNKGWELDVNGTTQKAVTPTSPKVNLIQGQNITITGDTANRDNVTIATADDVRFNTVRVGGSKTDAGYTGGIVIGQQSGGDSANPDKNDYITGLKNINWDSTKIQSGRAATEDQLKKVADDIKQGTVAGDVYVTGGEVSYHTDGGTDNGQPTVNDGTGKLTLTENNKTSKVEITGLHDYYVTNGTVTDDGKTLELTRNDRDEKGNPQKISVDLSNVLKSDQHLVANPADGTNGKYTVDATTGTVTLKVKNGDTYDDITIGGFEGLGQGLKFGANKMAKDGGGNPVINQLGSTIKIMGDGSKTLDQYSGKNLLTSVEQDDKGNTAVHVLMDKNISADGVTVGQAGKDGVAGADGEVGKAGTIGINGKNGVKGDDDKEGITTTVIHTEKGQPGENGTTGKPGVDGKDITRIVYQNDQDKVDGKDGSHTVATLDDGLKFSGDDNTVIQKKLNEQLQFVGGANKLTQNNIGVVEKDGKLWIQLAETPDLGTKGNLKAGNAQIGWFAGDTLVMTKDGNNPSGNKAEAGSYATGLSNKDWNVSDPEYVSGRAATEDQLAKVSEAITNATTAAGKRTMVTVNDKVNPAEATPKDGDYGDYDSTNGNLMIAAKKDADGVLTYNIKLNDNLAIGQKGDNGKDGKVTVDTKGGTTVVIGHDGEPGQDGKDGLFVTGKDGAEGKSGVSITGPNGATGADGVDGKVGIAGKDGNDAASISGRDGIGHIGLTGQKGADGKDGVFSDLSTILGTATLDPVKNEQSESTDKIDAADKSSRIQYQTTVTDKDGKTKTVITHEVATMDDGMKYAGNFGDGASVKLNKTVTIKGKVKDGAKEDDFVDGNIAVVANKNGEDGELLIKLNKDLTGLNSATYTTSTKNGDVSTTSTTVVDGTGLKIENGPSITNTGIDGGNHQITNVASGKDGHMYDTKVKGQEKWNNAANIGDVTNIANSAADGVKAKSGKNITVDANNKVNLNDNITLGDDKDKTKQVSINGNEAKITAGDGNNKVTVDGSKGQIVAGGDNGVKVGNIANGDSSLTIYDKDGKTTGKTDTAGKYVTNLDNKTWNGSYVSGRAATEDQLHQVESNVNKQIADVNTKIDNVDKHHTEVTVNGGTQANTDGSYTEGNLQLKQTTDKDGHKIYDLKLNDQLKVGQKSEPGEPGKPGKDGKDGNVTVETKGGTTVVIGHDGKDGRDGLFVTGKDDKDGKSGVSITGPNGATGADGVDGKVGIAGKDGNDAVSIAGKDGVGHIGLTGPKGADGKNGAFTDLSTILGPATLDPAKNVKGKDGDAKDEKASRIHYETTVVTKDGEKTISHEVATMDDGMKYSGDSGNAAVKLNNNVQLYGGAKEYAAGDNIGVVVSQDGDNAKMQVKLAKDLKGIDSIDAKTVTTGNTTINNGGLTVKGDDKHKDITIQQGTVNMGGNKIEGVAPGKVAPDSTEAINGSQLAQRDQAIGKLGGEVSSLDRRVDRVGAGAAALAALHPQDFDPDDKWDFAVGYGNYRGANAAAVGAFYRPNEDTTLSVGGTVGGGENMVNAGISFKFGQGNHVTNSRVAMAKEILALKDYVQKQDEKIEKLEALVGKQGSAAAPKRRSILFPDVPENHWAYAYVKKLADRGLLEGYPDGEFKGDRTITRYEFAAIFSRALENGASVDNDMERMSEEFEPEIRELSLNRFRVDRVEGKDNDRHKIERVRVNDRDELVKQKNGEQKKRYRDVYGSVIEKDAPVDAAK